MRAGQNADPSYRQSVSAVLLAGPVRSAAALTGRRHPLSPGGIPHRGGFVDREIHVNRRNFIRSGAIAASLALPAVARANTSTDSWVTSTITPIRIDVSVNTVCYLLMQFGTGPATAMTAAGAIRALRIR